MPEYAIMEAFDYADIAEARLIVDNLFEKADEETIDNIYEV